MGTCRPESKLSPRLHQKRGWEDEKCFCPSETPPAGLHPPLGLSGQEGHGPAGGDPEQDHKDEQGLGHLCYEDRLRELAMFILETGKLLGDLIAHFHHLKGACREDWDRLFIR